MFKKFINELKREYYHNKVVTLFMGFVILISFLTYLKPGSTENLLNYVGITAINLFSISAVIIIIWIVFVRKKGGLK